MSLLSEFDSRVDVMIDLETLGLEHDAVIVCVSAIAFEPLTGKVLSEFNDLIDPVLSEKIGFAVDESTVEWWAGLCDEARSQLLGTKQPREVMLYLLDWLNRMKETTGRLVVWGNGSNFDPELLAYHLKSLAYPLPWDFRGIRDVKTAVDLGFALGVDPKSELAFEGVKHVARDDSLHQVRYLSEIFKVAVKAGQALIKIENGAG